MRLKETPAESGASKFWGSRPSGHRRQSWEGSQVCMTELARIVTHKLVKMWNLEVRSGVVEARREPKVTKQSSKEGSKRTSKQAGRQAGSTNSHPSTKWSYGFSSAEARPGRQPQNEPGAEPLLKQRTDNPRVSAHCLLTKHLAVRLIPAGASPSKAVRIKQKDIFPHLGPRSPTQIRWQAGMRLCTGGCNRCLTPSCPVAPLLVFLGRVPL